MTAGAVDTKCHRIDGLWLAAGWRISFPKLLFACLFAENKGLGSLLWAIPFGAQSAVD